MADAHYFGHAGNQGDAVLWGKALGAAVRDMAGHQGHGSVAHPHGILITWATMTEGGFQVNVNGQRFSDESRGYSEQAALVAAQPGGSVWSIFDERIAQIARQFEDFRQAEAAGAVIGAETLDDLANRICVPSGALVATATSVSKMKLGGAADHFGRQFSGSPPLEPPYRAVHVIGALFHTQGGLAIDASAQVMCADGKRLPNLWAAGGAACGVSGSHASGYLSGNGLLSAVVLGRLAGSAAAQTFL
jgi:fumarate reductase flavoprotein subunit